VARQRLQLHVNVTPAAGDIRCRSVEFLAGTRDATGVCFGLTAVSALRRSARGLYDSFSGSGGTEGQRAGRPVCAQEAGDVAPGEGPVCENGYMKKW